MDCLGETGCAMGYEGKELQEFVREQQVLEQKEQKGNERLSKCSQSEEQEGDLQRCSYKAEEERK